MSWARIVTGLVSLASALVAWAREHKLIAAGQAQARAEAAEMEAKAREAQQKAAGDLVSEVFGDSGPGIADRVRRDGW